MKKLFSLLAFVTIVTMFAGCAPAPVATTEAPTTTPAVAAGPLEIKGLVGAPQTLTVDQLEAMTVVTKSVETPKSGQADFTGVLLSDLLTLVQVNSTATTLVFTGSDGYSAQVDLAAASSCADCMIAITTDSGLESVMPGQAGKAWVKNLITIELQ